MHYLSPTVYAYCLWCGYVVNQSHQNLGSLLYVGSNCSYFYENNNNNNINNNNNDSNSNNNNNNDNNTSKKKTVLLMKIMSLCHRHHKTLKKLCLYLETEWLKN